MNSIENEFDELDLLVNRVADAISGLERGDNVIYENETPLQISEMIDKLKDRKDLTSKQRDILQEITYIAHRLEDISHDYEEKMIELMETLED